MARMVSHVGADPNRPLHTPYMFGTRTNDVVTTEARPFVRLSANPDKAAGDWLIRRDVFESMAHHPDRAALLRDLLALPRRPTVYFQVTIPAGTPMRVGVAGRHKEWGNGGGVQFELLREPHPEWFSGPNRL